MKNINTLVLDIQELHQIIPETIDLENETFSDIKELFKNLIEKIEYSGEWEFIQYIKNDPSLFIIRQRNPRYINQVYDNKPDKFEPEKEIKNHYNVETKPKLDNKNDYSKIAEKINNKKDESNLGFDTLLKQKLSWEE